MIFNSIEFAIFLPIVFICYWFVFNKNVKMQNLFILIASYVFYGWWDWRFLLLIFFGTIVDFTIGVKLKDEKSYVKRKTLLVISLVTNLGLLGFFKYYNFFIFSLATSFRFFGNMIEPLTLNIILPVGISFYTFQKLSYTIDVYKRKIDSTNDLISFAAFVAFFPQLVAGPIERASNLLPQFYIERKFEYKNAVNGAKLILWGLFKKIVIADRLALTVNNVYNNPQDFEGLSLIIATIFFAFQIFCDFSAYSDIARGVSKTLGFEIMENFKRPYFSKSISEFWKRWHISLSTWFRDYLYIPLGGNRVSKNRIKINIMITFLLSGLWHGASWNFIIWGALNGFYQIFGIWTKDFRQRIRGKILPSSYINVEKFCKVATTFTLISFSWIFFRANNLSDSFYIVTHLFVGINNWFNVAYLKAIALGMGFDKIGLIVSISAIIVLEAIHLIQRGDNFENILSGKPIWFKWSTYYLMIIVIIVFGVFGEPEFIYFRF